MFRVFFNFFFWHLPAWLGHINVAAKNKLLNSVKTGKIADKPPRARDKFSTGRTRSNVSSVLLQGAKFSSVPRVQDAENDSDKMGVSLLIPSGVSFVAVVVCVRSCLAGVVCCVMARQLQSTEYTSPQSCYVLYSKIHLFWKINNVNHWYVLLQEREGCILFYFFHFPIRVTDVIVTLLYMSKPALRIHLN